MQPTIEILDRIRKNSRDNKEEIFTRLYRYLLRPDLYYLAYKNLYANKGAGTKGVNDDTADGFSKEKVDRIIQSLVDGTYTPNPVRREYIQKKQNSTKKASSWNSYLYGQAGAGSIENDIGIGLRANLLKQFSRLSSQQELPHCAEILEKRIFRCVVVY